MLNKLIEHKVTNLSVCGILVKEKACLLYKMDIIVPYFHLMALLSLFPLCTLSSELCLIPNIFLWMNGLKVIS
ncbi:hypothetical protein CLU79DRAFT_858289 [Phycomyces nitens]|nr:hypothetical protein CLU79DRAFT_858289 [Phycomyces nitens]